jgi:transposase
MLTVHLKSFLLGNHLEFKSMRAYRQGFLWEVELRRSLVICVHCGGQRTVRAGRASSVVREDPLRQTCLWLKIHKHRIYCKDCRRSFTERVPGIFPRRRSTQRFRKAVAQACGRMSDLSTVSRFHGVSHGFAYQVCYEQLEVKLKEHQSRSQWPEVLGLDEHFFRRIRGRTEFVTMITDLKKKRVFELVHGKDTQSLIRQLEQIPGREKVKLVVIDMSSTYKSFVRKFFPNAKLVADKFHVMRLFTPHIMKAGKDIHGHRQELQTRRKLLRSRVKLDYFVRSDIDRYLKNHDKLNEIYRWKEKLFEFYRLKGFARAQRAFAKLLDQMAQSKLEEVQRVLRTFKRWRSEILKYFDEGYTNAFTERMNGTGKLVQRRAFGYKSFRNYRLRTLSACLFKTF